MVEEGNAERRKGQGRNVSPCAGLLRSLVRFSSVIKHYLELDKKQEFNLDLLY